MSKNKILAFLGMGIFLSILQNQVIACSMYKITVAGKTMVGCNEDAWRITSRIWFENAKNASEYGVAFTGSRKVGYNRFAPQSGMNEVGLVFSRLASYFPGREQPRSNKKIIRDEVQYLTDIMHQCASVEEVKSYIEEFDHSFFMEDVFIYVDSSGRYLVVEPYELISGHDANYLLSNFCPSITDIEDARNLLRYRNGDDFLKMHAPNTSLSFCAELSDTMHVCRERNGDGTLLTSIWDAKSGRVNLYFYHLYDSTRQFNIREELANGDHMFDVADLFPSNPEFIRLASYRTPFNTPVLRILLVIAGGVLLLLSLVFLFMYFRKRPGRFAIVMLLIAGLNLMLFFYFFILATNVSIYYFDAPYKHYNSHLISWSSYVPFLILLSLLPVIMYSARLTKNIPGKIWVSGLLIFNNLIFIISLIGFAYWGLYDIL